MIYAKVRSCDPARLTYPLPMSFTIITSLKNNIARKFIDPPKPFSISVSKYAFYLLLKSQECKSNDVSEISYSKQDSLFGLQMLQYPLQSTKIYDRLFASYNL